MKEVHTYEPDLILLDNRLTEGFGSDFCKRFKSDPATSHYPVILISANSQLKQLAEECQADSFLTKPFDLDELLNLVSVFLMEA